MVFVCRLEFWLGASILLAKRKGILRRIRWCIVINYSSANDESLWWWPYINFCQKAFLCFGFGVCVCYLECVAFGVRRGWTRGVSGSIIPFFGGKGLGSNPSGLPGDDSAFPVHGFAMHVWLVSGELSGTPISSFTLALPPVSMLFSTIELIANMVSSTSPPHCG